MVSYRRDSLLAAGTLGVLLSALVVEEALASLLDVVPALAGIAGALLVEAAFLRSPAVTELWERPSVQVGSGVAVSAGGLGAYVVVGPAVLATLCWGIVTYFALLGAVLALGENPLATLVTRS